MLCISCANKSGVIFTTDAQKLQTNIMAFLQFEKSLQITHHKTIFSNFAKQYYNRGMLLELLYFCLSVMS